MLRRRHAVVLSALFRIADFQHAWQTAARPGAPAAAPTRPAWHGTTNAQTDESVTQDFWSFCLSRLESELPPQQFSTWIKALKADDCDNADTPSLRLLAPNRFVLQWVRERYLRRIGELGEEYHGTPIDLQLVLPAPNAGATTTPSPAAEAPRGTPAPVPSPKPAATPAATLPRRPPESGYDKTRLNADFSFDNLVTGRANDLARAAAMQ
ncbi:MAG TPA: DnaA N-terminal domain-containing protein, partial [Sphingomonadales bacterium]